MSKNKRGSAADIIYANHLFAGEQLAASTNANREVQIENMYRQILTELAVNRFKWDGLPDSVDPRFLEMTLFYTALAVFYEDEDFDKFLAVRGSGMGYVNMLDNPTSFTVIAPGSVFTGDDNTTTLNYKTLSAYDPTRHSKLDDAVRRRKAIPIWANAMRYPLLNVVSIYAKRLATLDRTIEINSENARRNKVLKVTDNMKLSAVNFVRQVVEGVDGIQVGGPMQDMEFVEALDLGINPDSFEKLHILRVRIWNECMGLLGIDNANQDKKERLVASEVGANSEQTDNARYVSLNWRQYAADQINDVFGLNISVDYRTELEAEAERAFEQTSAGVSDEDGEDD